jgi:hypothetical protein
MTADWRRARARKQAIAAEPRCFARVSELTPRARACYGLPARDIDLS